MSDKNMLNLIKKTYSKTMYLLTLLLPLKNRMIFESDSDFSDNSKALFDEVLQRKINNKFEIIWLVENPSKFNYLKIDNVSFQQIGGTSALSKALNRIKLSYLIMRSKYYFFSHRDFSVHPAKKGQVYFNLTHGSSLKDLSARAVSAENYSYILSTSDFASSIHEKFFLGGESKRAVLGYPRNDLLFENKEVLAKLDIDKLTFPKVIIWMPTFRRGRVDQRNDSGASEESLDIPIIKNDDQWMKLNQALKLGKALLLIKPHPAQDLKYFKLGGKSNIRLVTNPQLQENSIELYNLLGESDALITDYSSVYMNYLLLDRPIGFTVDDMEDYSTNLGFVVDNPLDYMPGAKIKEFSDMLKFTQAVISGEDEFAEARSKVSPIFNKYFDDQSSKRVLDFLNLT